MDRPFTLLISAMGGEGGGILTGWIVAAAHASDIAVQATSVPGVAQRSGATTYYIELAPRAADGRTPVFCLFPVAGQVDIVLASELLEGLRAVGSGYVTPDRTTVLASSHRVYSMTEKTAMGDGRLDPEALCRTLESRAERTILIDMDVLAREHGVPISAVMLGSLAGAGMLPISRDAFEDAIRSQGKAVDRNLAAFAAAFSRIAQGTRTRADRNDSASLPDGASWAASKLDEFPLLARDVIAIGLGRLTDYQSRRYARLYLRRLEPFASGDHHLCKETARHLALRMAYEDVIRVAQLKMHPDRFARIRDELGLEGGDPFHVIEFLKPGIAEFCDILPAFLAKPLQRLAARHPRLGHFHIGMRLRSTTVWGYVRLLLLARMRLIRRLTSRYDTEQREIERWLVLANRAAASSPALGAEVVALSGIIKGYADTAGRSRENLERILSGLVEPILDGHSTPADPAGAIAEARQAALADPEGKALDRLLSSVSA